MPVCSKSGHRASPLCDEVDTLYMPAAGLESGVCPYHRLVHLSPDGRHRVNSSCEAVDRMVTRSWFVLPPAQEYYYSGYHVDYRPLPPFKPGCAREQDRQIELIYPEHGAVLYPPKGFSGRPERFIFRAAHARPDATLYWHLNETYVGETRGDHSLSLSIKPGAYTLTLVDDEGGQKKIRFEVK